MARQAKQGRLTVQEYERMAELGIIGEHERVELVGGEIIRMAAMGRRHARSLMRMSRVTYQRIGNITVIRVQMPVAIPHFDEPEPDIAVLRPREDDYENHPAPDDVLLLIEVSDTSLAYDRGVKLPLYARAGIPEVWIVNLAGEEIERYTEPAGGRYRVVTRAGRGETLASVTVPELEVEVDAVLG